MLKRILKWLKRIFIKSKIDIEMTNKIIKSLKAKGVKYNG